MKLRLFLRQTILAAIVVMTHSHALDYELCRILLTNTALRYTGLIGSQAGSRLMAGRLKSGAVKVIFGVALLGVATFLIVKDVI